MANVLLPKFRQQLLNKQQDLDTDGVRLILLSSASYTYDAAHEFLSDVPAPARVAMSSSLSAPTIALGVFDTADVSIPAVSGADVDALYLVNYGMGGADAARGLIAFYDTGISGLPFTPNGGQVDVTVGVGGWFAL